MVRKWHSMFNVFCSPAREPGRHGCEDDLLQPYPTPLLSSHLSGRAKVCNTSNCVVFLSDFIVLNYLSCDQDPDPDSVPDPDLVPDLDLVPYLGISAGPVQDSASAMSVRYRYYIMIQCRFSTGF